MAFRRKSPGGEDEPSTEPTNRVHLNGPHGLFPYSSSVARSPSIPGREGFSRAPSELMADGRRIEREGREEIYVGYLSVGSQGIAFQCTCIMDRVLLLLLLVGLERSSCFYWDPSE